MYILGINAFHADVSAVLLRDGELVAAVEEERFRRIKHYAGFPAESIRRVLAMGGITGADVEHVAVSRDPRAHLLRKALFALRCVPHRDLVGDRIRNARSVMGVREPLARALGVAKLPRIHHVEHHPAHLASAFFASPFADATVCAIDGFGDFVSTSTARGQGNRLRVLDRVFFPHSLGMLYTAVTQHLGFPHFGDEFKVMGLAPYGTPDRVDELRRLVRLKPGGAFELELKYFRHASEGVQMTWDEGLPTLGPVFSPALERLLGPARAPGDPLLPEHEALARSLQAVYEECAFHVLSGAWERTRNPRLALAGGCGMNSVANGKIRDHTPFRDVYVQPAAGDNGTALGAAYWVWNQRLGGARGPAMEHACWGTAYPEADVAALLAARGEEARGFTPRRFASEAELCRATAELVAGGSVVGWYQGRMEWGSRALGNRSIVADPRRADMRERINTRIKFREKFRPFAPSVLEECIGEYFEGAFPDPFMQQVYPVRPAMRAVVPAVTHVDGSGRLQTVNERTNPRYHALIRSFWALTGVPMLLNTSFNENEPIVDTPEQALDCFLRTRMDAVVINDTMIRREQAPVHDPAAALY